MTVEYRCPSGHVSYRLSNQFHRAGKSCVCECGKRARPVRSLGGIEINPNHSGDPMYMDADAVAFHLEHKQECERQIAANNVSHYKPGKNRHFRAEVPRKYF